MTRLCLGVVLLCFGAGCAHKPLSGSALDRVIRPAFVSRIEDEAGPKSYVFRGDGTYGDKLKKLSAKEADRRLAVKLASGSEDESGNKVMSINRSSGRYPARTPCAAAAGRPVD
ncbi:MAG: hypothetical protein IPJ65_17875 [Archangiaceae bacterium]|nr:hypothetical protein [Archangiaceae bacterium]